MQVQARILQRSGDRGAEHVARHPDDEQLAEAGIEDELRRHAAVAAAEDGGVGLLPPGQLGQHFLLQPRKVRIAAEEARVAALQALQRLVCGASRCFRRHGWTRA
jgi:hypothetical protein